MKRGALVASLGLIVACEAGPQQARPDDEITVVPEGLTFAPAAFGDALLDDDAIGLLLFADFFVADVDGFPRNGIKVEVTTVLPGLALIPEEAVKLVDYPEKPDGVSSRAEIIEACTNDDGQFISDDEWCAWHYDVDDDEFYSFGSEFASTDPNNPYQPNYLVTSTNSAGLARAYMFLDSWPSAPNEKGQIEFATGDSNVLGGIGYSNVEYAFTAEAP